MQTVAIVEDHALLAETLQAALRAQHVDATVLAPDRLWSLRSALLDLAPDLVLLDLDLGQVGDSTEIVAPLRAAGTRVLLVTGVTDRTRIASAIEQGAIGYQPKALGFDALLATVRDALAGVTVLDPADRVALLGELAEARAAAGVYEQLTDREQGTLRALGEGQSVREIADYWVVSESTVRTHVRGVLVKLGVASQLAAVAEARRNGWLTPLPDRVRSR